MAIDEREQYVNWQGLRFYDSRIKDYIRANTTSIEDKAQFRADIEQLEELLSTLTKNFATDKEHIYQHIEECKNSSATKEELQVAIDNLHEEIRNLTGIDLNDYATKEFVEERLAALGSPEIPDNLVTTEDIQNFVTKEELNGVESKIPTKVSELHNDAGYLESIPDEYVTETELDSRGYLTDESVTHLATTEQLQTVETKVTDLKTTVETTYIKIEDGVTKDDLETAVTDVVTSQVESIIDDKIEEVLNDGATVSEIAYGEF